MHKEGVVMPKACCYVIDWVEKAAEKQRIVSGVKRATDIDPP